MLQDAVSCTRETDPKYRCTNQHGMHGSKTEKFLPGPFFCNQHPLDLSRSTRGVYAHRTACAWKIPCISGGTHHSSMSLDESWWVQHGTWQMRWIWILGIALPLNYRTYETGTCCCSITRKSRSHASDASQSIQKQKSHFSSNQPVYHQCKQSLSGFITKLALIIPSFTTAPKNLRSGYIYHGSHHLAGRQKGKTSLRFIHCNVVDLLALR